MPPPPAPSASYNLVIEDSSSEEDEYCSLRHDYRGIIQAKAEATVHRADGCPVGRAVRRDDVPWAEAHLPLARRGDYPTVEAASVTTLSLDEGGGGITTEEDGASPPLLRRSGRNTGTASCRDASTMARIFPAENEFCNDGIEGENVLAPVALAEKELTDHGPPPAKKKKKKKKKRSKKIASVENETSAESSTKQSVNALDAQAKAGTAADAALEPPDQSAVETESAETPKAASGVAFPHMASLKTDSGNPKAPSYKSVSFGTVSVREYARMPGLHVVPADGGWPLGLSGTVIAEHPRGSGVTSPDDGSTPSLLSSPGRLHSGSVSSACTGSSWSVNDFEWRRQGELQERYVQLIRRERRRKFEKELERRHHHHTRHNHNTRRNRGRSRSGSFGRCNSAGSNGGGCSTRSGSSHSKVEMTPDDKEQLEIIIKQSVTLPQGVLETRPYDYKKKLLGHTLKHPKQGNGHGQSNDDHKSSDAPPIRPQHTEEEELYHNYGGRNPLFLSLKEEDRRRVLLRDDHLMKQCRLVNDKKSHESNSDTINQGPLPLDPSDAAAMQHIQHDLETLRIQRNDPRNLGCSCRKLHVFLPGSSDKSHHKKKGSHRRLPERRIREELRRRCLLNKGNEGASRAKMEGLLHDAIERESCCWGNDCPCVRNGIGCQSDICSCWHASHDATHGPRASGSSHALSDPSSSKAGRGDVVCGAELIKVRCGNKHGMYVVDLDGIARFRARYVTTPKK